MKKLYFSTLILSFFILTSCVTTKTALYQNKENLPDSPTAASIPSSGSASTDSYEQEGLFPSVCTWTPVSEGFDYLTFKVSSLKVSWTCIRIDLTTPGLKIVLTPDTSTKPGTTFYLSKFARKNKTIAAINTTPFDNLTGTNYPVGLIINEKNVVSEKADENSNYCALILNKTQENTISAKILLQSQIDTSACDYAIGGFFITCQNNLSFPFVKQRRSRTGAGISADGKYLYLMAVTPDFSLDDMNGLTYEECNFIFQKLGCSDAMQFDGGHSTGMCINGRLIQFPLFQRKIPVALGFKIE